ncbi:bifunctional DNA primase/polymerase [Flexivirga sp.]|uniref:bifunctional DNA primase/polymerase n=1 Tax=Flexivirga sp. TaxID=1962927 RepID=UPI003F823959
MSTETHESAATEGGSGAEEAESPTSATVEGVQDRYARAAPLYRAAGWPGVLPLPYGAKTPVPKGFTGTAGVDPSGADVAAWCEDQPSANLALRMPADVLGVDVDHHDDKRGGDTLADLERELGALPPTWRSTSRGAGVAGIRLYRVPEGLRWPGVLGKDIDTVRREHRYVVAWPSVHPEGGAYQWISPDGNVSDGLPGVGELPALPNEWVQHFTRGELATLQSKADVSDQDARAWLTRHNETTEPCARVRGALAESLASFGNGSRHEWALSVTNRLCHLAGEGHQGVPGALSELGHKFAESVSADRAGAVAEWDRAVSGAVALVVAQAGDAPRESCQVPASGVASILAGKCVDPLLSVPSAQDAESVNTAEKQEDSAMLPIPEGVPESYRATFERAYWEHSAREWAKAAHREQPVSEPSDFGECTIAEALTMDAPAFRVADVMPSDASTLLIAQAKAGKTTMALNLARALIEGGKFLARFAVLPIESTARVALLNFEVNGRTLAGWADRHGIDRERIVLFNLRGMPNPLGVPAERSRLAARLRELKVETLIVDPFANAYAGAGDQDNNSEVSRWLIDLAAFARAEAGCRDLILTAHAGHAGQRVRGASALNDWPDAIWTLTVEDDGSRYFKATGRDVDVAQDRLSFDPETSTLSLTGLGSAKDARKAQAVLELASTVEALLHRHPAGMTSREVRQALRDEGEPFRNGDDSRALAMLTEQGLARVEVDGRRQTYFSVK